MTKKDFFKFLAVITGLLLQYNLLAQDIILTKGGARINANVMQITDDNVFFKYFDNPNGSTYSISKNDVSQINYQNGRIESFETNSTRPQTATPVRTQSQQRQPAITPNAQDVITMKDGHKINAIVREITATQVLFIFTEPNGELYYVNKNDVSSILYRDGRTESFAVAYTETPEYRQSRTQTQPVTQSRQQQESVVYDKLNPYNQNNYLPAIRNTNREDFRRFNWGVKAGINIDESFYGRIYSFYASELINMNKKLGFHIGINARVMFTAKIGIESGLYFIQYGKQTSYYTHTIHTDCIIESTYNSFGFKFPITFLYKINVGHNFSIYPYLGYITNISRKISYSREYSNIVLGHPHNDYYDHMAIIPVDTGFTVGINLQFSKITTGFGYDIIIGGGETGNLAKLSVGYFFK